MFCPNAKYELNTTRRVQHEEAVGRRRTRKSTEQLDLWSCAVHGKPFDKVRNMHGNNNTNNNGSNNNKEQQQSSARTQDIWARPRDERLHWRKYDDISRHSSNGRESSDQFCTQQGAIFL